MIDRDQLQLRAIVGGGAQQNLATRRVLDDIGRQLGRDDPGAVGIGFVEADVEGSVFAPLTDNSYDDDGYRFHDVLHAANVMRHQQRQRASHKQSRHQKQGETNETRLPDIAASGGSDR